MMSTGGYDSSRNSTQILLSSLDSKHAVKIAPLRMDCIQPLQEHWLRCRLYILHGLKWRFISSGFQGVIWLHLQPLLEHPFNRSDKRKCEACSEQKGETYVNPSRNQDDPNEVHIISPVGFSFGIISSNQNMRTT